jgi:ParB-like chromosome segregation protein Spo0J
VKLKIDKEFEKLIPPLQDTEFSGLTKSILKYGCQEPIEIWNNTIIDGHNRYKICKANNIPFEVREMDFSDRSEALVYIIEKQFGRRNLLPFQRSELAMKMKNVIQAKAKEKQEANLKQNITVSQKSDERYIKNPMRTDEELSKLAGVSRDTIRKAEKIIVEGNDEQKERARTGGKGNTVNAIFNEIVNAGENSRICTKCGKELPIKDFDGPRKICRRCRSINREFKDVKGNKIPVSQEINQLFKEHGDRVFDAITSGDVPEYTIENFVEELTALAVSFQGSVEACFLDHPEFDVSENKQKIIAALSAAEAAIKKIKEFG